MRKFGPLTSMLQRIALRARWRMLMWLPNETRIRVLRKAGVRIGRDCLIYTNRFSTEPYLIEIGHHVAISSGTSFITHDASGFLFHDHPDTSRPRRRSGACAVTSA
jgi:hypothetical protein